ncbi:MAG TPA: FoF1 ATP synthase subunit a [Acholeplasma sp.]|nr:FoF1 ATP synthase subunit a [Acholeplasma sp.]
MIEVLFKIQPIPSYLISSWVIMLFLIVVLSFIGYRVKHMKIGTKPSKLIGAAIFLVEFFNDFVRNNVGKMWKFVTPMVMTLGIYIFVANISGLFGLETPTRYTAITFPLTLFAVITIQATGIISRKWRHIKTWFEPLPFMFPINLVGDVTPLLSMTLRLFGNIASGAMLLTLVYEALGWFAPLAAVPLHALFDIGFGFIQAMVFVLLTVILASLKMEAEE